MKVTFTWMVSALKTNHIYFNYHRSNKLKSSIQRFKHIMKVLLNLNLLDIMKIKIVLIKKR